MANNCGGIVHQWEKNKGKCGVCGDPYDARPKDHEPGGLYATGIIGKTYYEGQKINITIDVTANHMGYFEFRICVTNDPLKVVEQDCFDENLLVILNNNERAIPSKKLKAFDNDLIKYKYFLPMKNNSKFYVSAQLPVGLTCSACILQWRYHAGNNYGTSGNGKASCLGCAERQEEFFNCADIEILNGLNRDYTIENNSNQNQTNGTQNGSNSIQGDSVHLISMLLLLMLLTILVYTQ